MFEVMIGVRKVAQFNSMAKVEKFLSKNNGEFTVRNNANKWASHEFVDAR